MAYTLTDPFGALRTVFRLSSATFLLWGGLMLFLPGAVLAEWGAPGSELTWPVRLAGALLCVFGIFFLMSANERAIGVSTMVACTLSNGLAALVLLIAYLQREFIDLTLFGLIALIVIFVVCLIGAVAPLRYLRAEYRDD